MKKQQPIDTREKCAYCHQPIEQNDLEWKRIWSPNWKRSGGQSPARPYHRSKGCGGFDQMGHEG